MRKTMRHASLWLLLLLLCLSPALPQASLAASGTRPSQIRVLLQRLNLGDEAWLTLDGRYLARGGDGSEVLLPVGSRITVLLREGRLVLFCDGLSLTAGKRLELLRRADGDTEPGVHFNLVPGTYPGDLALSVKDGAIRPVLTLPLETYLLGVVPYEMNDSFPAEALKVQAVCARTYALSKLDPSAEYDVVDNTNDQVYRGTPDRHENTAAAVEATEGLVLTSGGRLITAWYSASNGGQTELPGNIWSGSIPDCFAMTDDPWDAANPDSTTRTAVIRKDGQELSRGFLRLLREALADEAELKKAGLTSEDTFHVDAVTSIELTTPRYKSPSRLMTKMILGLEIAGTAYSVTLDLFPEAVFMLGLSVYGADNELVTVAEDDESFTLTSGRFGHGVGMSQRGAQYMASEGNKTYREILDFYYPGAKLKRYEGEPAPLPTAEPLLAQTPGPVPTATPRPTLMPVSEPLPEGAWLATVENIDEDSTLNLREMPSPGAKIIMRLYKHQRLAVLEEAEVTGWVRVRTDAVEGYVMLSFLQPVK